MSTAKATTTASLRSTSYTRTSRNQGKGVPARRYNTPNGPAPRRRTWSTSVSASLEDGLSALDVATASETDEAAELARLRAENAKLRSLAVDAVKGLDEDKRRAFEEEHRKLQEAAKELGEDIPAIVPPPAAAAAVPEPEPVAAVQEPEPAAEQAPPAPAPKAAADGPVVLDGGVILEMERDTLVFKFGAASKDSASSKVSNGGDATSMSVDPSSRRKKVSSKTAASKDDGEKRSTGSFVEEVGGTLVFKFGDDEPAAKAATPTPAPSTPTPAAAETTPVAAAAAAEPENPAPKKRTPRARSASSTATSTGRKTVSKKDSTTAEKATTTTKKTTAKKADPFAAAKTAANKEVDDHDPQAIVSGRENWLYFTVPEVPVAGADCVFYYNKAQSEPLRHAGRIQIHPRFNNWEVDPQVDNVELQPAAISKGDGVDYYSVKMEIPEDVYEINFVFSNGEGQFDNNYDQNFQKDVSGAMTKELWLDAAPERAEAAYLKQKEEERIAAEKAEAERKAAAEARDAEMAQDAVNELKSAYDSWRNGAAKEGQAWKTKPAAAAAGVKITLLYNRLAGPLSGFEVPEDQHLVLKLGHNGWKSPSDVALKRTKVVAGDGDWWEATIAVPEDAAVINFVINYYEHYDNNNGGDHKIAVDLPAGVSSVESWANSLAEKLRVNIKSSREAAEAAAAEKQRKRDEARQAARDKAMEVRRAQMKHVLYTEPEVPQAGKPLTLYYNPNNTNLAGRERVFLRGGYNRWKHPKSYGPIEMTAPSTVEHFSATIDVPKDAYSVDFVFSEMEEGGVFDNRGGLDYNFPCKGAVVHEPPLNVCHIAVEMAPICKVGGLGDVVTSLSRAVQEQGHNVEVILPRYDFFLQSPLLGGTQYETEFDYNGTKVFVSTCVVEGIRCFFLEPRDGTFATNVVYQGNSDAARFDYFCKLALEFLLRSHRQPDILHCHDWSSADVAKYYWNEWHHYGLWKPKVVFTIHNLNYGQAKLGEAAYYSQRFTTVSPSYAWEIGGNPILAANNAKLMGIRNGIDIDIWDPETDQFLPVGYTADNVVEGKRAAREELRRRVGLSGYGDKPLVGVVTRLTKQKGTHLIAHACWRTLDRGGQYVLLGSAPDPKVQAEFAGLASQYGGDNAAFCFSFDEPLSHLIYAACDYILVPSMFEPCGLTQMIAMRYGAIPVVRATGGLKDTVFDVDTDKARAAWELLGSTNPEDGSEAVNGFAFEGTDEGAMDYALNRAFDAFYNDREWIHSMQERVMRQDWSWNKPAVDYISLYHAAIKG